jgi:hypothetical protein
MKTTAIMRAGQLERFARFLEEHPGFAPLLEGDNAVVFGFQTGDCMLTLGEMESLIAAEPNFDAQQASLLLSPAVRRP